MLKVVKRDGSLEELDLRKIYSAIEKAFDACCPDENKNVIDNMVKDMDLWDGITIEEIQDIVIETLRDYDFDRVADKYQAYKDQQSRYRFIQERIDYMEYYTNSGDNAASSSETDPNSNVSMKNVANLEGEVYKGNNREIQRYRMKKKLKRLFPEVAAQYEKDLEHHIIYTHDEASTPVLKPYCKAVTLYPLLLEGVGNIDGITPGPPNDIQSFSGQVTNLAFLLSSQCKGAVAFGDYFIALNYYVIQEFGPNWFEKIDTIINNTHCTKVSTIKSAIRKGMKQFIYGVNQPAGNRSYNSPFTNLSFYDSYYFKSLFEDFFYPDGSQPTWEAIDTLQRIFMELHRELRLIKPLTFPVTTMALVHNNKEYLDKEYKELCAEEWAKGGSFFCYNNDNPTSLASCCRVLNEMSDNTFSSTTGMTGVMTGSVNVITLNLNRIIQDWFKSIGGVHPIDRLSTDFKQYLIKILERVYKYHIAYKTMLYELEEKKMLASSNGNYIYIKKLYSTIGILGYFEAAKFLGITPGNNPEYIDFLQLILGTIRDSNKEHSIRDKERPFLFNSEAVPKSLGTINPF